MGGLASVFAALGLLTLVEGSKTAFFFRLDEHLEGRHFPLQFSLSAGQSIFSNDGDFNSSRLAIFEISWFSSVFNKINWLEDRKVFSIWGWKGFIDVGLCLGLGERLETL